jgi:hypothetical protein
MRSIFIALVVINIVVFAVQWFSREPNLTMQPLAARIPVLDGASLQLIEEAGLEAPAQKKLLPQEASNAAVVDKPGNAGPSAMCTMVGPYAQLLHAEYLVEKLHSMEVIAEIRSVEVPAGMNYWVYLAPEISEREALRRLHEVQAKKIDSYLIPNGELANGISLGMFSEKAEASARVQEIRDQGYQPEVREVPSTISEIWVALPISEAEKIDPEIWVNLLQQQSGLEKRQNYCLGVAPG